MRLRHALVILVLVLAASPLHAHSLGANCRIRDGKVEVEAYFSDDTAAADARVRVLNAEKKVIASGRTDAAGRCLLAVPPAGKYQLSVDAGDGHRVTRAFEIVGETVLAQATVAPKGEPKIVDKSTPLDGAILVSEGPSREEFTAFPWAKVAIGVGAIVLFTAAFLYSRRGRQKVLQDQPKAM